MAPVRRSRKNCMKRTILFAATVLFTASVLAQTGVGQGKSAADAAGTCAALSNQDTTKPAAAPARTEINVEEKGDEFLIARGPKSRRTAQRSGRPYPTTTTSPGSFPACPRAAPCRAPAPKRSSSRKESPALALRHRFTVLLAVREEMNFLISASGIGGDFRYFESRYEIVPLSSQRARIVYQATLVPGMTVPPIVGPFAMRSMIGTQFDALLAEIRPSRRSLAFSYACVM